ncbi:YARHG domain-containing protein [Anaerophilus nitritogenes]|uniref:YARHG domain-containing protein n=1 Tax=Anaerophilus nitritogenes TaxID=2498136 RepID=UPI0013EB6ADC|nr:YARHG domain-containing protein [Anaerophilus nitritogenes]
MKKLLFIFVCIVVIITGCNTNKESIETKDENTKNKTIDKVNSVKESGNSDMEVKEEKIHEQTNIEYTKDYIFPKSDTVKLTFQDIYDIDFENLDVAKNEIYARKGYIFQSKKFSNYFSKKEWYHPNENFTTKELTPIEMYNINLLSYFENLEDMYEEVRNKTNGSKLKQKIDIYDRNKEIYVDLNGDGVKEKISYKINMKDSYCSGGTLFIDDQKIQLDGYSFLNSFAIVDINVKDHIKEIVISDEGPSSDYTSQFFYYDGNKIHKMGEVGGLYDYGIQINGLGKFSAMSRADILQTWFFDRLYKLDSNHKIVEIKQDVFNTNSFVFVKKPLKVYVSPDTQSNSFILKEATVVNIVGTDNKEWCLVETKKGKRGWFSVDDDEKIKGTNLRTTEFFIGLCFAD